MKDLLRMEIIKMKADPQIKWVSLTIFIFICGYSYLLSQGFLNMDIEGNVGTMFNSLYIVNFYLIIYSSKVFSEEFSERTIINIISKGYSRERIYAAKIIVILSVQLSLYFFSFIITCISSIFILKSAITLEKIETIGLYSVGSGQAIWMIISIVLLLSILNKRRVQALVVGNTIFLCTILGWGANTILVQRWSFLRWNIINVYNLGYQLIGRTFPEQTQLSIINNLVSIYIYIIIGLSLGLIYSKKIEV